MDKITTIDEVKNEVKKFCEDRSWGQFHNAKDLAIGISTEANELLQIFRFKSIEEIDGLINSARKSEIEDEIADIFYFLLRFAEMNNIDLTSVLNRKIQKNSQKYPIAKSRGCNKKYNEYDRG